jgi:hypothetical protein
MARYSLPKSHCWIGKIRTISNTFTGSWELSVAPFGVLGAVFCVRFETVAMSARTHAPTHTPGRLGDVTVHVSCSKSKVDPSPPVARSCKAVVLSCRSSVERVVKQRSAVHIELFLVCGCWKLRASTEALTRCTCAEPACNVGATSQSSRTVGHC